MIDSLCWRHAVHVAFCLSLLTGALNGSLPAQELSGRVQLGDTPVGGQEVVLHRVSRDTSGSVGQAITGPDGRFAIQLPPVDTAGFTVFFTTVEFGGIRHFGYPVHPGDSIDDYTVTVFDTVTAGAPGSAAVRITRRDIVMLPESDGGWEVNELVRLSNPGLRTLVAPEGKATWEFRIPAGATAFELGEGEIGASELLRMGDRALLAAPLLPGSREIFLRYRVPAGRTDLHLAIGTPTDSLNLFVRDPAPAVEVRGLRSEPSVQSEVGVFRSFVGTELEEGSVLSILWQGESGAPVSPVTAALGVAAVFLLTGLGAAFFLPRRAARPLRADDYDGSSEPREAPAAESIA
jgi:hypothetical protein